VSEPFKLISLIEVKLGMTEGVCSKRKASEFSRSNRPK